MTRNLERKRLKQSWHAGLFPIAALDFFLSPRDLPEDGLSYWAAILGLIVYRTCLIFFWITLNCCTIFFGVYVEPPWRDSAKFRLLQLFGSIPTIAIALPMLLAYAAYRTFLTFGFGHVILPFAVIGMAAPLLFGLIVGSNTIRRQGGRLHQESSNTP